MRFTDASVSMTSRVRKARELYVRVQFWLDSGTVDAHSGVNYKSHWKLSRYAHLRSMHP